ncbi:MAG: 4Fe-4S dicluster domain-containing protein [Planctomyces sp.]|nr:4Fe-4S dicluster domain-containing protein [Planctomyces sp.]
MTVTADPGLIPIGGERRIPSDRLQDLIDLLRQDDYSVVGPTVDQEAIVYDEVTSVDQLPRGWTDEQGPGTYRLARREDDALFGYVVGPHSWKKYLFPPLSTLSAADRTEQGWEMRRVEEAPPKYAFLGVRACELAAIAVQDRVFAGGPYVDPIYSGRRQSAFLIAVNCTQAASTCFCTSMRTGPRCCTGFDLALTELPGEFVIEVGSDRGGTLLARLTTDACSARTLAAAEAARQQAVDQITRRMDTTDIRNVLLTQLEHPRWQETGERCLSCTNCTMVCPTCFCSTVEEVADLKTEHVERQRRWDSCFNPEFSYVHGGLVRNDIRSRYRQWLTHKLASWQDQFGTSGCVGCGRCITWCPVGIDLTEEVAALREKPACP